MTNNETVSAAIERFLGERERRPRLLGLGEPLHGAQTFPRLRNALLRRLVDDWSCRCVTLESDGMAGRRVDDYVQGGDDNLDEVMADGITHGFGAYPENRAMVEWLREHNSLSSPTDRVRFAGFDAPMHYAAESPREALRLLHSFLTAECASVPHPWSRIDELLGDDDRWSNPDSVMDPSASIGDSVEARELRVITDDLGWLLTTEAPGLAAERPAPDRVDALRDAELAARTAAGLLAYHAVLARTDRQERITRCAGIRDAMMASNLEALASDAGDGELIMVFAHNEHVRRGTAQLRFGDLLPRWSSAGAHIARAHGPGYVAIAIAIGSAPHLGIDAPPADTVEGVLAAFTAEPRLVPIGDLSRLIADAGIEPTPRTTGNRAYVPLNPDTIRDFDAVLFLPRIDDSPVA